MPRDGLPNVCYSCCLAHCPDGCHLLWRVHLSPAVRQDMSTAQGHRGSRWERPVESGTVDYTLLSCWNCRHCVVGGCAFISQCVPLAVLGREGAKGRFTKRRAPTIQKVTSQRPSSRNHHEVWCDEKPLRRAAPSSASGGQQVVISRWAPLLYHGVDCQ